MERKFHLNVILVKLKVEKTKRGDYVCICIKLQVSIKIADEGSL
jgi:hypothetical protein